MKKYAGKIVGCENHILALRSDGTVLAYGNNDYDQCNVKSWRNITAVACNRARSVGLTVKGTVLRARSYTSPFSWQNIVQVAISNWEHIGAPCNIMGLRADGRVMCSRQEKKFFRDVCMGSCYGKRYTQVSSDWRNVAAIACSGGTNYGLLADGTVVACGSNKYGQRDKENWKDVVSLAAGDWTVYGIRKDGQVYAQGYNGNGECEVGNWRNIIGIMVGANKVFGLTADGSVVYAGRNKDRFQNIDTWTDIVALAEGGSCVAGLKADGTVVRCDVSGYCDTSAWQDIVAIACGCGGIVGLQADGTVVYTGMYSHSGPVIAGENLFN